MQDLENGKKKKKNQENVENGTQTVYELEYGEKQ